MLEGFFYFILHELIHPISIVLAGALVVAGLIIFFVRK